MEAHESRARITIVDTRGTFVDELEIAFDHPGNESAAGEERGRRIRRNLSHRDGYHL